MKGIALALFPVLICAAETSYFTYGNVNMHMMCPYPMIGVGARMQKGMHALDFSANTCPRNPPRSLTLFHMRSLYLAYPGERGFYCGAGLGLINEPETMRSLSGSFEGAIGYQSTNRFFLEVNNSVPFAYLENPKRHGYSLPGLTLGLGF